MRGTIWLDETAADLVGGRREVSILCYTQKGWCRSGDSNPDGLTPLDLAGRDVYLSVTAASSNKVGWVSTAGAILPSSSSDSSHHPLRLALRNRSSRLRIAPKVLTGFTPPNLKPRSLSCLKRSSLCVGAANSLRISYAASAAASLSLPLRRSRLCACTFSDSSGISSSRALTCSICLSVRFCASLSCSSHLARVLLSIARSKGLAYCAVSKFSMPARDVRVNAFSNEFEI